MSSIRVALHALDRTGPPMLAYSLLDALAMSESFEHIDVVAFRGGDMLAEFTQRWATTVMLDDHQPWDHSNVHEHEREVVSNRTRHLDSTDVTLLVSVAAGQVLPYMSAATRFVCCWVVEVGDDLHWLDSELGLAQRVNVFVPGSRTSLNELSNGKYASQCSTSLSTQICPEFVTDRELVSDGTDTVDPLRWKVARSDLRRELDVDPNTFVVLGVGIRTYRKAPDVFVELAAWSQRHQIEDIHFLWIGGDGDELAEPTRSLVDDLGLTNIDFWPPMRDLTSAFLGADVFAHVARLDAFPLVCLHAALAFLPTVSFIESRGTTELFGETFRGVHYPDIESLGALVVDLTKSDCRHDLGEAQRNHVVERYTSDKAAHKIIDVCSNLVDLRETDV